VVDAGHIQLPAVKLGQRNGLVTEIIEGVSEGEVVINHPSDEIDNNRRVKIRSYQ
jgi:HlyD family secretion protein